MESLRPARIVVADDDRFARELVANILRGAGHVVEAVADGQEAVDRVAQGGVELALLDIVMPRLSGLDACRILKGLTSESFLPVVLVTAKTDTASRVEGLRIGADDYVCKPFDEQELLARVHGMLRIKRLHDQLAQQKAKFERLSVHDELTGLYNYRYLHTRLTEEFKRAERYHEPFACVLIDIDQLRAINDVSGRGVGDLAIKRVSEGIRRCVRDIDVVARYGGDEFLVVLPSTHFAGSVVVAERIWRDVSGRPIETEAPPSERRPAGEPRREGDARRSEVEPRWSLGPREMTISIGVALYPSRDVRSKDALLRAADAALAQAKREGGNRICVFQQQGFIYSPSIGTGARTDSQIMAAVRSDPQLAGSSRFDAQGSSNREPASSRFDSQSALNAARGEQPPSSSRFDAGSGFPPVRDTAASFGVSRGDSGRDTTPAAGPVRYEPSSGRDSTFSASPTRADASASFSRDTMLPLGSPRPDSIAASPAARSLPTGAPPEQAEPRPQSSGSLLAVTPEQAGLRPQPPEPQDPPGRKPS